MAAGFENETDKDKSSAAKNYFLEPIVTVQCARKMVAYNCKQMYQAPESET